MLITVVVAAIIYLPMLIEARRAAANERLQRARGGVEPPDDVFEMMRAAYPGAFLLMMVDGAMGRTPEPAAVAAGAALFAASKALKWWAILTLGPAWTFRVIVVPGATRVATGPYRWLRHPNYVGVLGELAGAAAMAGAPITGVAGLVAFAGLLVRRIAVENVALRALGRTAQ